MAWIIGKATEKEIDDLKEVGHHIEIISDDVALSAIQDDSSKEQFAVETSDVSGKEFWIRYYVDCDAAQFGLYALSNIKIK